MPNVDTRKRMLDKILERREEIRNSEEIFKIHKYAHVFKKLLYRFRLLKKKKKIEEEAEKKIMSNDFPIK